MNRLILYTPYDWQSSNNTPWFCFYAESAIIKSINNFIHNPYISTNTDSLTVFKFINIKNLTINFFNNYLLPIDRKSYYDHKSDIIYCALESRVISNIRSSTEKIIIYFKNDEKINLGNNKEFSNSNFIICNELILDWSQDQGIPYAKPYFKIIIKNILYSSSIESIKNEKRIIKDNNMIIKDNSITRIEPYNESHNDIWLSSSLLRKFNEFHIDEMNTLSLIHTPKDYKYMGSTGNRNVHRYERIITTWKRKFQNYKEASEYLLSLNLAEKFISGEWKEVYVHGGTVESNSDEYIEDNR